ncbi:restriction endonuclease subunit S [Pseudosulfitobacter sp. DSM 107133]|uniref:restriction endonuclease subunit S n=1 Tax=Pseudosulfitobacter sp. DSM 107133 TaxID=2883100 RepID=UPI000DF3D123|nr:restriction endonuclease subunit S [Pseudosulfitobacter sp. DSM 107133]UOA26043.1 hypothetical protein DSM107133_00734 [Pseudosulfitobacter sp. DSM 107133]
MTYPRSILGEHVNFSNGKTSPERDLEGGFPVYGSNGLIGFSDITNSPAHTSVIGRVGSYCGSIHFSKEPCWVTDNAIKATAKTENESRFWYYAMSCQDLHDLRSGSGQPLINQTALKAVELPVPSPSERLVIASILGALDDKIELNRRMSATLEEMARSLYRSWFVDFDPVHAKMEGLQPAFMDEATAALFPDRFGEDGLPEGWERGCIGDIAQLNPEKHTKKSHPDAVEYVDLSNTKWGIIETTTQYSWEEAPSRARMLLREQDTIVGTVRPGNGSYSYIGKVGLTGSTGFAVLRPTDTADVALVYLSATDTDTIDALANLADGGAYPAVRPDVVASQPVVLSSHDVRTAFQELVAPLIGMIEASKAQSQTLAYLRDTLLPKLMSGEIRVGEAREHIEEVA